MYFETTILSIYNFLILYGCLYEVLYIYIYILVSIDLKSWIHPWYRVQMFKFVHEQIFLFFYLGLTRLLSKSKTKIKVYLVY